MYYLFICISYLKALKTFSGIAMHSSHASHVEMILFLRWGHMSDSYSMKSVINRETFWLGSLSIKEIVHPKMNALLKEALLWYMDWYIGLKPWFTLVMWITYWLLWCIYQLYGLSFRRHPFTAEDPLVSKWCNAKYLQIYPDGETNSSSSSWMSWEWVHFQQFFLI